MEYDPSLFDFIQRPDVSKSFRELNPHLVGPKLPDEGEGRGGDEGKDDAVRPKLERSAGDGAVGPVPKKVRDTRRFLVRVTSIRRRLIDEDNLCEKYVVDCCRYAGLLPGDGPGQTKIEVGQRKVGKEEDEGTLIEIFELATGSP